MCLQCLTEAVNYGEVFHGFVLMQAKKTDYPERSTWKEGQWALVEVNDPTVYFTFPPMKEDTSDHFSRVGQQTDRDVMEKCGTSKVYRIMEAAKSKGYNPIGGDDFGYWLTDYLARYLETAQPIE